MTSLTDKENHKKEEEKKTRVFLFSRDSNPLNSVSRNDVVTGWTPWCYASVIMLFWPPSPPPHCLDNNPFFVTGPVSRLSYQGDVNLEGALSPWARAAQPGQYVFRERHSPMPRILAASRATPHGGVALSGRWPWFRHGLLCTVWY